MTAILYSESCDCLEEVRLQESDKHLSPSGSGQHQRCSIRPDPGSFSRFVSTSDPQAIGAAACNTRISYLDFGTLYHRINKIH